MAKRRVCIVGAGAAGLCATRHFARDSNFEVRTFEQTNDIGGTWVYNEKTGLDENGLPIHSSMYRDLRTNLPARIMNFPDYLTMNAQEPSCVTHEEVLNYLRNYAEHFDLRKHIQFHVKVESVRPTSDPPDTEDNWIVRIKRLKTLEYEDLRFHAILICNGHYFDPYLPAIPGLDSFTGTTMHSHTYRKPEDFNGKTVLVLGASASGVDIGLELCGHVTRVYLSHNNDRLTGALPPNMTQVSGVERVEGSKFFLKDGSFVTADVFLLCTGYRYSFPFLEESCGIRVDENYVTPLYKHLINIERPTMCIVGVPSIVVPFPMFHVQARYFLALLKNRVTLPSKKEMLEDSRPRSTRKRHAHRLMHRQWEYNDSLADAAGFERLPAFYKAGYSAWAIQRKMNLTRYKDAKFVVSDDGLTVELVVPE